MACIMPIRTDVNWHRVSSSALSKTNCIACCAVFSSISISPFVNMCRPLSFYFGDLHQNAPRLPDTPTSQQVDVINLAIVGIHSGDLEKIEQALYSVVNIKGPLVLRENSCRDAQSPSQGPGNMLWPLLQDLHAGVNAVTAPLAAHQYLGMQPCPFPANNAPPVAVS